MAVYIAGDTHGGMDMHKLSRRELRRRDIKLGKDDYLIILGDFGFPFLDADWQTEHNEYHWWIKWFRDRAYTVLFIDGNHENFNFWDKQEITEWHNGKVQIHPHASNVIHLMRGEVYDIEGNSYFAFGGAASYDKKFRMPNHDWWHQEEVSETEMANAERTLAQYSYKVDYILSHTPPSYICDGIFGNEPFTDKTAAYLTRVMSEVEYKLWLSGHIHKDIMIPELRFSSHYQSVLSIEDIERNLALAVETGKKAQKDNLAMQGIIV